MFPERVSKCRHGPSGGLAARLALGKTGGRGSSSLPSCNSSRSLLFAAAPASEKVRADHQESGKKLCYQRLNRGVNREPHSGPIRDTAEPVDLGGRYPMSQLHFLRLLAHHNQQHDSEHAPRQYEHLAEWKPPLRDKRQYPDKSRKN